MSLILVVEDDDAIRSNILRLLVLEGFETASATEGITGLAQAKLRAPDLNISDVNMPGMDGFELLAAGCGPGRRGAGNHTLHAADCAGRPRQRAPRHDHRR